ncbi:basic helix-loop-helix protein [Coemansia javaensis]|uniref:Basic helix-loop-helix protein n=1 Tax=Coemansia javaensis TaxID=2761396 RepID=A0A9W8LDM4_9FUNG|nr:basic helix-loop-helix protein [Coemansia javaensis]
MSATSPSSSVLLTVEDKGAGAAAGRGGQYTAIAPRGSGPTGLPPVIAPAAGVRSDGTPADGESGDEAADSGDGSAPAKRRRGGKEQLEPGSPEWHRMRRDSHKEVERRRREVINGGIDRLAELVPGAEKNKGRIIAQAVDYIHRLRTNEEKNIEKWTIEKLLADQAISELTAQVEQLRAENRQLREWIEGKGGSAPALGALSEAAGASERADGDEHHQHQDAAEDARADGEDEGGGGGDNDDDNDDDEEQRPAQKKKAKATKKAKRT